ncbi:MAG TPA: DUF3307 domain-containing protein [Micromonosporaceae bacterium]
MPISTQTQPEAIAKLHVMVLAADPLATPGPLSRALVFAVSLLCLLIAHQLGDHVLQTDRQAARKATGSRRAVPAMLGHLASYHAAATVVLVGVASTLRLSLTVLGVVAGLAFSAGTHALLDLRWPVRMVLRATGASGFADAVSPVCGMYAADQALHQLCLLVSALLIASL